MTEAKDAFEVFCACTRAINLDKAKVLQIIKDDPMAIDLDLVKEMLSLHEDIVSLSKQGLALVPAAKMVVKMSHAEDLINFDIAQAEYEHTLEQSMNIIEPLKNRINLLEDYYE